MESESEGVRRDEEEGGCAAEDRGELESIRCVQRAIAVHAAVRGVY